MPLLKLFTTKYFGFRSCNAAIFSGSWVSVAEKSSFWHEDDLGSSKEVVILLRVVPEIACHVGATASGYGIVNEELHGEVDGVGIEVVDGGGSRAERTLGSHSWKDCAMSRSASSITCVQELERPRYPIGAVMLRTYKEPKVL